MASDVSPWKLGGLGVTELGKRVWAEFSADEVSDRAAALAYYFLFALFPTLLFLTALLGLLPIPDLMDRLMGYVSEAMPGDAASIMKKTLSEIVSGAGGGLLSIGVLGALWAGSNGMSSIMSALNVAYDVEEARPWWKAKLVALGLTIGFSIFILSALVLLAFGPKIGETVASWIGLGHVFTLVWNIVSIPVIMVLVAIGIALVYYLAPNVEQHWRWVTPGSVVALVLWLVASFALRFYVANFANYNATYGSIGGVILLMLWLYLSGMALLLGAEVNAEIEHAAARRGAPDAKDVGEQEPGDNVLPFPRRTLRSIESVQEGIGHLARLEVELAIAEVRRAAVSAGLAVAATIVGLVVLVTSIVVLVAAAFAPVFEAHWQPLLIAGGGGSLLAGAALAWAAYRLRNVLTLDRTRASIKETWRWAETRLRSAKTSSSPVAR
ncbi:MAG TPA: YhjD/YihY/BrkB family envelope integrity protein [Methylomirabilota bacterium]|jgi:membrane protein|nr:YhjD/YihY/BrkB family envelope integrity protein [Methylomirabilota bacterium]